RGQRDGPSKLYFSNKDKSCPAKCNCVTSSSNPSADCSYRDLESVPNDLPSNLSHISLSVNLISTLDASSFAGTSKVKSLWLGHNQITTIQSGTFKDMPKLESLDLGYNQLVVFPWTDLSFLHDLQILILNNNHLVTLPANTFNSSKRLRSLQLNGNKIISLPDGLFDPLTLLSHLKLYNNPLNCSCHLYWLKDWMEKAIATIDKKREITCASPTEMSGVSVEKLPDSQCRTPLQIQGHDPLLDKALLLCKQVGTHNLISNSKQMKVTIDFLETFATEFQNQRR
uniref:LRRCT domain-containing protein n=1 Tax=Leptobrachium leishanense TaxID=445787 RepID=A0A8C5WFI8_9ANUR